MTDRHSLIVTFLQERGYATIEEMARAFDVTPQTIRRDINTLAKHGDLRRHHGGASLPSSTVNAEYAARRHDLRQEKSRLARALVATLPERTSVFIALGTTMEAVAAEVAQRSDLKVVTNSTAAAAILNRPGGPEIFLAGGAVRRNGGTVGQATVRVIEEFRCDVALMSCGGIEADGSLLDYDYAEVTVMRAMIDQAHSLTLVVDHNKFLRRASVRLGHLREVDVMIVDRNLPAPLRAVAAAEETRVILAR